MKFIVGFFSFEWLRSLDFLAPLAIRLLLAPILWVAGTQHLGMFAGEFTWWNPMTWFNAEAFQASAATMTNSVISGMGAEAFTTLIGSIEIIGAVLLVLGFAVRWVTLALIFVVVVLGMMSLGDTNPVEALIDFATNHGYSAIATSGIGMYITYLVLLLSLFFMGAGRWFSLDWYFYRSFMKKTDRATASRMATQDPFEIDATDEPGISKA